MVSKGVGEVLDLHPGGASGDPGLDEGGEVSVTIGAETFCPIKFHAFVVGPCMATVRVRAGETAAEAGARARETAKALWDAEWTAKFAEHPLRVRKAAESVR